MEINLSERFFNVSPETLISSQPPGFCHHIISDTPLSNPFSTPDEQASVFSFLPFGFQALAEKGFLILWHNLEVHAELRKATEAAGFIVQPHPIIWNNLDPHKRSSRGCKNPFPPSYASALVAWKPDTIPHRRQGQAIFSTAARRAINRVVPDPLAKPVYLWYWLYSALTFKGQVVFDPWFNSGISAIAGLHKHYQLWHIGTEPDQLRYLAGIANLQNYYVQILGPETTFK